MANIGRPKRAIDVSCCCEVCGKTWSVPEWQPYGRKYCSRMCFHQSRLGRPQDWNRVNPTIKKCEQCSKEFATGGGGRPPRHAKYCSQQCVADALSYLPPARHLKEIEAAWLAGVFDGEGNICFAKGKPLHSVRISVPNTCQALILRIQEVTGTGSIGCKEHDNPKWSTCWIWRSYGKQALNLLKQMLPWLIVKREEALVALSAEK